MKAFSISILVGLALLLLLIKGINSSADPELSAAASPESKLSPDSDMINLGEQAEILTNPTKVFREALNGHAKKVIVPNLGQPYVVGPILVQNGDKEIILEPGVVIQAKPGEFKKVSAGLLRLENVKNVTIRGNGATLRMNQLEYRNPDHEPSEHRHGLSIAGSKNILVEDLTVEGTGGDGVYIGGAYYTRPPYPENSVETTLTDRKGTVSKRWEIQASQNVTIRRVIADRNHRQGLSLISGENILIEDCVFKNTSGTAPTHGLDIEPGLVRNVLKNIVVRNCIAENNDGAGFAIYLRKLKESSEPVTIRLENCEVRGSKGAGLVVGALGNNEEKGVSAEIVFKDCIVKDTEKAGIYVYDKSFKVGKVVFDNCHLINVARSATSGSSSPELAEALDELRRPPIAPIVFYLRRQSDLTNQLGGVVFKDCRLQDEANRPVIAQGAKTGPKDIQLSQLSGTIKTSHADPTMALGESTSEVTLELFPK